MTRALQLLWFTRGLTTLRCGRRRHWRGTSGAWSRRYAAHHLRRRSSWRPIPTYRQGHERFSRLFALNKWLLSWCKEQKLLFVNNWNLFWERPRLFRADGMHLSRVRAELLSDNISRTLRTIWLVSQFSNNCYDNFCSTHLNDRSTCIVQSIQTVSVPRIVRSKYTFNAWSRKNLIVIKPEKCKINEQKFFLKLGLLNIRSLTPKAVIVNEMITDNSFDVLCLTETWLKPNDYIGINESTPPSYCYKHEPRQTGRGGGVAIIYSDILNVTQKTGYRFNSFEILLLNVTLSDMQNKSVLSLALATVYRPPGPYTDFLKEFADFLSDLLVNVDKALIVGDFNIHVDNTNDALGLAFTDLINYFESSKTSPGPLIIVIIR